MTTLQSSPQTALDYVLENAIVRRSSDIHIDSVRSGVSARFRVDGILQQFKLFDDTYREQLIARTKVVAKMNITESRIPQDGHFEFRYHDNVYSIRASSIPSIYGESIVLRIIYPGTTNLHLESLGFDDAQLKSIYQMSSVKGGIVFITGPTGSGKSSLLYAILNYLNKPEVNIISLEDPVEYQLDGVRQIQINDSVGLTFLKAMRSVVRQDPNIIMLGEIRDAETAELAVQASLIGITVFTTFHTYNVPGLISRLYEMGIAQSILGQSLIGVVSSRLVRKICPGCKTAFTQQDPTTGASQTLYRGEGCAQCKQTGFLGRTGIFEVIPFDTDMKKVIIDKQPPSHLFEVISLKQLKSLYGSGVAKVQAGETTYDEVARVLGSKA